LATKRPLTQEGKGINLGVGDLVWWKEPLLLLNLLASKNCPWWKSEFIGLIICCWVQKVYCFGRFLTFIMDLGFWKINWNCHNSRSTYKKELGIWFCILFYQNKNKNSDYCS
jgi:hypothetical protein